jgi:hypothetical protein
MLKYVLSVIICFAACGLALPAFSQEENAKELPPKRPLNVGGVEREDTGTISGIVLFKGEKPEVKEVTDISGNAFCKEHHKNKLPRNESIVFGKNGGDDTLANVLVYVSKGVEDKTFEPPKDHVVLDQVGCVYTPHVVAVMVGQTLEIHNSDATLHNVMSNPRVNPPFNFGMPVKGGVTEKVFKAPEFKMNLKCFMHPWMSSYVHVLEHPFFAVTQSDGTFTIKGLPPGEYEVTVLHETSLLGPTPETAAVTVAPNETSDVEFTYQRKTAE